jgi:hypothetical protein
VAFKFQLAEAFVKLTLDDKGFLARLANARRSLLGMRVGGGMGGGMLGMLGLGRLGMAGLGAAGLGGGLAGLGKLASSAEEIRDRFVQVFKEQASAAEEFADRLAKSLGRSKTQIMDTMTLFQIEFMGAGMSRGSAREMSQWIQQLSMDLAAFHNISEEDAAQKLFSGLLGNSRALYSMGINLKVAALEEERLRLGWTKQYSKLTELERMYLRMSLVTRLTADAQGHAARESSRTAGSWRSFLGAARELGIALGTAVLPAINAILKALTEVTNAFIRSMQAGSGWGKTISDWATFIADNLAFLMLDLEAMWIRFEEFNKVFMEIMRADPWDWDDVWAAGRERERKRLEAAGEEWEKEKQKRGAGMPPPGVALPAGLGAGGGAAAKAGDKGGIFDLEGFWKHVQMLETDKNAQKMIELAQQQLAAQKKVEENTRGMRGMGHRPATVAPAGGQGMF